MKPDDRKSRLRLRIVLGTDIAIGPGKADLLDGIRRTGSIAAAGREMGMSYKRAWHLIATMNRCFRRPVVEGNRGGKVGGGSRLTPAGQEILASYRRLQRRCEHEGAADLAALRKLMVPARKR